MEISDLLAGECARIRKDFRLCAAARDRQVRHRLGVRLLGRIAAHLLCLEYVAYPPLAALGTGPGSGALQAHERIKRRTADALLSHSARTDQAYLALCRVHQEVLVYHHMLRRWLVPLIREHMSEGEQASIAREMKHWIERNREAGTEDEEHPAQARLPLSLDAGTPPRSLDARRLPTLRHMVAMPVPAASAGLGLT